MKITGRWIANVKCRRGRAQFSLFIVKCSAKQTTNDKIMQFTGFCTFGYFFFLSAPKCGELCNVAVVSYDPKIAIVNE